MIKPTKSGELVRRLPEWCKEANEGDEFLVKTSEGGKIHQVKVRRTGPYTKYRGRGMTDRIDVPAMLYLSPVCRYGYHFRPDPDEELPILIDCSGEKITCRNCLKHLGIIEPEESMKRFVLMRKDTKQFFKKQRYSEKWVVSPLAATLYRVHSAAYNHGKRGFYYDSDRNLVNRDTYWAQRRKCQKAGIPCDWTYEYRFDEEKYEVKEIKLSM